MKAYQFKIQIMGARPPIWRRVIVPAGITFSQLQDIFNTAVGWEGYHLACFRFPSLGVHIERDIEEYDLWGKQRVERLEARSTWIDHFFDVESRCVYVYDFGDNWQHQVTVEEITEDYEKEYARVIKYKGDTPCEDSGGIDHCYFDEPYDVDEVNERLKTLGTGTQPGAVMFPEESDLTLQEILSEFRKEELVEIAKIHHLKGYSKFAKNRMVDFLCRELLDRDVMRRYFQFLNEEEWALLDAGNIETKVEIENDAYNYLLAGGYGGYSSDWIEGTICVPQEVLDACAKNCDAAWRQELPVDRTLLMYLNVAAELYGICPIEKALELYVRDGGTEKELFDIIAFCQDIPENKKYFVLRGEQMIVKPCLNIYKELLQIQGDCPFYEPAKEEIEHLGKHGYLPFHPSMNQLKKFFMEEGEEMERDAHYLCCVIQMIIRTGGGYEDVMDVLETGFINYEDVAEDEKALGRLMKKLGNVWKHTNTVLRRGNMIASGEEKKEKNHSNIIAFPGKRR